MVHLLSHGRFTKDCRVCATTGVPQPGACSQDPAIDEFRSAPSAVRPRSLSSDPGRRESLVGLRTQPADVTWGRKGLREILVRVAFCPSHRRAGSGCGFWPEQVTSNAVLPSRNPWAAGSRPQTPRGEVDTPEIGGAGRTAHPRRLCRSFWKLL